MRRCSQCGLGAASGSRFCSACGTPLGTGQRPARQPERLDLSGERKRVSILFADVVGSLTHLSPDPEEASSFLDDVLDRMHAAVAATGGCITHEAGDGIMALFGAPLADDDHAFHACETALAMRTEIARAAEARGLPLTIRVGIATGEAVVGTRGLGPSLHYTAHGLTVHLASRLEKLAPPGGIAIATETFRNAGPLLEVTPLPGLRVPGLADSVDAHLLLQTRSAPDHFSDPGGLTPFVSRDAELAALRAAVAPGASRAERCVLVVGEPGLGKSRLLREFGRAQAAEGWRVAWAGGRSHRRAGPLQGIVEVLARVLPVVAEGAAALRWYLQAELPVLVPHADSLVALLGDMPAAWIKSSMEQKRLRITRAVAACLDQEARRTPLLIVVDDLHWLDPDSQEILGRLPSMLAEPRLALVAACRADEVPAWGQDPHWRHLALEGMPAEDTLRLVDLLLGDHPSLLELRLALLERTAGNPLFVEESIRELAAAGTLVGMPGAYCLAGPLREPRVPGRVQDVISIRIDRLPRPEKRVLQYAAVLGPAFEPGALTRLLPEGDVAAQLAQLKAHRFVGEAEAGPSGWRFRHPLIHEVAYGGLLRSERRAVHQRILGGLLAEPAAREGRLQQVAFHSVRAEAWDIAADSLEQAGHAALARSACAQAATLFEEALAALAKLDHTPERLRQQVTVRLALRNALFTLGRLVEIPAHLEAAAECQATLGDPHRQDEIEGYRAHAAWLLGRYDEALRLGEAALAIAERLEEPSLRITSRFFLGLTCYSAGRLTAAIGYFGANAQETKGEAERQHMGFFSLPHTQHLVVSRSWLAWCLMECGRVPEALAEAGIALALSEEAGRPFDTVQALMSLGAAHLMRGEVHQALPFLERAFALCREAAITVLVPRLCAALGYGYALAGDLGKARALGALALSEADRIELPPMRPICLRWHVETALLAGALEEAAALNQRLLKECLPSGQVAHAAWASYYEARIAIACGVLAPAEAALERAAAEARRLGLEPLRAQAARWQRILRGEEAGVTWPGRPR